MKASTTLGEPQQHPVMPVKTGIQEEMDPCSLDPSARAGFARMTRIRGINYEMGHLAN